MCPLLRRQYESGVLITGVQLFTLPPERLRYELIGTCHSTCTRKTFKGPVWVTSVWNHMHYAGRSGTIELIRNNTSSFIINETSYSYDSPQVQN
ncbi:unnamed protein product [Lymnaea stagnalis]|uniref:Copper type II ascorbate-dependent monooxygenase C-terminal domain-containing protein n=1 Tax=Lymnaea stagnalis TaxID=6523 RepID=A0AAV2HPR4_LYMST